MSEDFPSHIMEQVALRVLPEFLGEPNKAISSKTELRWGSKGSISVDIAGGTYFDHEDQDGGGVIKLLQAYKGFDKAQAVEWLTEQGFLERRPQTNGHAHGEKFAGFMDTHPVAIFQYHDDHGRLAYEVLKFAKGAPRRFMQRRPYPSGGWIWGLHAGLYGKVKSGDWFKAKTGKSYEATEQFPNAARWLYRRDEVLKAKADGKPVMLAEGEKDVETLRAWGFVATTNVGGAQYWEDGFDLDLTGADVVLLPDNDDAGRQRVLLRGAGLKGKAKSVRVLDLAQHWPDAPQKADVSDWKEAGGTAERFLDLTQRAPLWQPTRPRDFGAYYDDEVDGPSIEHDELVDGWLTERGRSVIGGPSGSGKSFLALHTAYCIARGIDWFGHKVTQGAVIYQAGEGGTGMKKRQRAYKKHFNVPANEQIPIVMLPAKVDLFTAQAGDTDRLISTIKAVQVTLSVPLRAVFIDTLATATIGADENSGKDMSVVLANIARIEAECKTHVCLVHHMNADGKKLRGHTSIQANVDTVILVTADESTKIRTARLAKQKDGEDGLKQSFTLASVTVGHNAKADKPVTSCVVLTVTEKQELNAQKEQAGFAVKPSEEALLIPLFSALKRYGKFVASEADGPAEAIGKIVVDFGYYLDVAVEMDTAADDKTAARDRVRKSFGRNTKFLVKCGIIAFKRTEQSGYVWWAGRPVRGFPETFPEHTRNRTLTGTSQEDSGNNPMAPASPGMAEMLSGEAGLPFENW